MTLIFTVFATYSGLTPRVKFKNKFISFHSVLQSILDFASSLVLLLSSVTITDFYRVHHTGILGWMECHLWNSELLSFGLFVSSTWNIVILTIERFVSFINSNRFHNPRWRIFCWIKKTLKIGQFTTCTFLFEVRHDADWNSSLLFSRLFIMYLFFIN